MATPLPLSILIPGLLKSHGSVLQYRAQSTSVQRSAERCKRYLKIEETSTSSIAPCSAAVHKSTSSWDNNQLKCPAHGMAIRGRLKEGVKLLMCPFHGLPTPTEQSNHGCRSYSAPMKSARWPVSNETPVSRMRKKGFSPYSPPPPCYFSHG